MTSPTAPTSPTRTPSNVASPNAQPHIAVDRFDLNTPLFRQLEVIATEDYLDLAGFPHNYHCLNTIQLYGRRIVPVDDFALHLVWKENPTIQLVKALPDELFKPDGSLSSKWTDLHLCERSLLYSYLHLILGRRDLDIAINLTLVPEPFHGKEGWTKWKSLCHELGTQVQHFDYKSIERLAQNPNGVNPFDGRVLAQSSRTSIHIRYWYGDLRLSRLNEIALWARLIAWLPWEESKRAEGLAERGYFFQTRNPVSTFWTGFGIYIVLIFGYLTTTLTAMQVALAAPATPPDPSSPQSNPYWFSNACKMFSYLVIFVVFIQAPLAILYVLGAFVLTWLGWRKNKRRNPALGQTRKWNFKKIINHRDMEAGLKGTVQHAVLGASRSSDSASSIPMRPQRTVPPRPRDPNPWAGVFD